MTCHAMPFHWIADEYNNIGNNRALKWPRVKYNNDYWTLLLSYKFLHVMPEVQSYNFHIGSANTPCPGSIRKYRQSSIRKPVVQIHWPWDRRIFSIGFPVLVRQRIYIKSVPQKILVINTFNGSTWNLLIKHNKAMHNKTVGIFHGYLRSNRCHRNNCSMCMKNDNYAFPSCVKRNGEINLHPPHWGPSTNMV